MKDLAPRSTSARNDVSIEREVIAGPGVPATIGPYSPGVRAGNMLYVAGQPGVDPDSGRPAGASLRDQARQALQNVESVLQGGGRRPGGGVNGTLLVAGNREFDDGNEVFGETFP